MKQILHLVASAFLVASCAPPNRIAESAQSSSSHGTPVEQMDSPETQKVDAEVKQLLEAKNAEEQKPRFDLDAALQKAGKESKSIEEYDQQLNEISAHLKYDRIGERGDMQIRFNHQNYRLGRMVAAPWDLERARLQVERSQMMEKSQYDQRVIREDAMIDAARALARAKTTELKSPPEQ